MDGARSEPESPRSRRSCVSRPIDSRRGFTLIELMVVIVVISVLAGVVAPQVFQHVSDAKLQAARSQIESLGLALDSYRLDNAMYPTAVQGLAALWQAPQTPPLPPRWRGPYTRKEIPNDPWNRPYLYRSPGTANPAGYDLLSLGRDGEPGGEGEDGDITSWGNPK
ncbi:MAG: type II secretion system major pseudopilin GspG [Gemmatimonadetes bacterium]|nr:type II secretion system major pseudopilin GspG [Gemmatimonadota bacterium]